MSKSLFFNIATMAVLAVLIPIFGFVGDKVGKMNLIKFGMLFSVLFSLPIILIINQVGNLIFVGQLAISFLTAMQVAALPSFSGELFTTGNKFTGISVGLNISAALFGGTAPLIAALVSANSLLIAVYMMAAALLGCLTAFSACSKYSVYST